MRVPPGRRPLSPAGGMDRHPASLGAGDGGAPCQASPPPYPGAGRGQGGRRDAGPAAGQPGKAGALPPDAHNEDRLLALSRPESFSLYVSVPFCPTRCAYCSFVSHTVERAGKLVEPYVERLAEELEATGRIARELGLRLETVYFGGRAPPPR